MFISNVCSSSINVGMRKFPVFGLGYNVCGYDDAATIIVEQGKIHNSYTVAALPVHGLIESYRVQRYNKVANNIDMVVPDGYPVVWAINLMYKLKLPHRICGADLTLHVLKKASDEKLNVYLYGSYKHTIERFAAFIHENYPGVNLCGIQPDRFREATMEEDLEDIERINSSGAHIVLVGRGCPRQEYWIDDHKNKIKAAMMAIGGAFDWHAKTVKRAPKWMQDHALEWLHRLVVEPRRLWKRYLITNTIYLLLMTRYILIRTFRK
jgi:N-acetylglucosaminyldiphosphoundecaprenol N-acetyl-beta-D-mannosaminyltransferase